MDCLFFEKPNHPLNSKIVRRSAQGNEVTVQSLEDLELDAMAFSNLDLLTLLELNHCVDSSEHPELSSRTVSNIVSGDFFHTTAQELIAYLGRGHGYSENLSTLSAYQRAYVAKHYNAVLDLLQSHYGFEYDPSQPLEKRFCASQLVLKSRFTNRSFDLPSKYSAQLESLYEPRSLCDSTRIRSQGQTYRFTATRNMVDHLAVVANRMIPFGVKLEEIDPIELGSTTSEILQRLLGEIRPFCALVRVLDHEPDLGVLACLYTKETDSFWINDVDLIWLSQVCTVAFEKVLLSRSYVAVPHDLKPNSKVFSDPLIRFSPAANTVAHIHLMALVGATTDAGDSRSGLLSTWLKSIDKAEMLIYARMAKACGFEVLSFGLGRIDLLVHESLVPRFMDYLVQNGFQSPTIHGLEKNLSTFKLAAFEPLVLGTEMML